MTQELPNRNKFVNFRKIVPKGVKAANKMVFLVTGVGCMKIQVPNGKDTTAVILQDVLYCPDLGYMLVSLANCDAAGFTILLKDKSCCIKDPKGCQIGQVPQHHGLYCMDDEFSTHIAAYKGVRVHTLDELHWKMGHISHAIVKHLNRTENSIGT